MSCFLHNHLHEAQVLECCWTNLSWGYVSPTQPQHFSRVCVLAFQLISSMIYLKSNCHNILDPKEFHVHLLISVAKKLNMLSIETISILGGGARGWLCLV